VSAPALAYLVVVIDGLSHAITYGPKVNLPPRDLAAGLHRDAIGGRVLPLACMIGHHPPGYERARGTRRKFTHDVRDDLTCLGCVTRVTELGAVREGTWSTRS
jgi:hypothetical protein